MWQQGVRPVGGAVALQAIDTAADRLVGWKSIGAFLGCDARTAKRWERSRAMPVHRVPGDGVPTVWADRTELRLWLRGAPAEPVAAQPVAAAPPSTPQWRQRAPAVLVGTGIAAGTAGLLLGNRSIPAAVHEAAVRAGPYDDDAAAQARYLNARFELGTRSAAGIAAAERDFQALTIRFPDRAAGYSGLADAHVLSREFGAVPDAVAFPRAAQAARTALALDPGLADAWLNRAFVAFWWQRDLSAGLAAFHEALKRAPDSAKAHHWLATALIATGDIATARTEIARARELDPNNHAIVADAAFVEISAGNYATALPALEALAQLDPDFAAAHRYLALGYLMTARDADYLREAATTARLIGRRNQLARVELAASRWRSGGRRAMLDQLIINAVAAEARGDGCINDIIGLHALAGDRIGALRWLANAKARHPNDSVFLPNDPMMIAWRHDPAVLHAASAS